MLNDLQRRYTLNEIEAQHENQIVPRLNYDAITTLRNPMYVKMGASIQEDAKNQQTAITEHHRTTHTKRK